MIFRATTEEAGGHIPLPEEINTEWGMNITNLDRYIAQYAQTYGVSADLAQRIMWCESRLNANALNYNKDEEGIIWSTDIGYWQLNDYYWSGELLKQGWEIDVPRDNLEAGFYLLSKYGTILWEASEFCHSP